MMDKINVNLYGGKSLFGGKETPLEADIIYCDKAEECTFYKENKCLRCRSLFGPSCKFGRNEVIKGYTSRAKKYHYFKSQYEHDETYGRLEHPLNLTAVIGDTLYMNLKYVSVRKRKESDKNWEKDVEGYMIGGIGLTKSAFIPLSDITNTLLYEIFSYEPCAMMGGIITDYQQKVVPDIIQDLKKIAPEIYEHFISEYPQYDIAPNYIGKYAYIKTMVDGSTLIDCRGNSYTLRGGKLYCDNMRKGFVPFNGESAKVEVTVKDNATYKITSNDQCDENTRFK